MKKIYEYGIVKKGNWNDWPFRALQNPPPISIYKNLMFSWYMEVTFNNNVVPTKSEKYHLILKKTNIPVINYKFTSKTIKKRIKRLVLSPIFYNFHI